MDIGTEFRGAKLMLFIGDRLAVILRDDKAGIPWPDHWDFPGGEAEPGESPAACALRETAEELGLELVETDLSWARSFCRAGQRPVWFFAARLPTARADDIVFGNEGQGWQLMAPETYLAHKKAIPHFAERLQIYLKECG